MKLLKTITDKDLGLDNPTPAVYVERNAARAIVFDNENNIALLHASVHDYHKLPGGGVEQGEDITKALEREMLEEIGCKITNLSELGIIEEYRNKDSLHQISHCFIAKLDGEKGDPQFTQSEIDEGFEPIWLPLDEAIKLMTNEKIVKFSRGKFMVTKDLLFLEEAKKLI